MNIEQAKTIPISVILDKMGKIPKRTNGRKTLYSSPLRNEKTPSFWVNELANTWRDYGDIEWKGGDGIHLVRAYLDSETLTCGVSEALRWLRNMTGHVPYIRPVPVEEHKDDRSFLKLRKVIDLEKEGLYLYAENRGIPRTLAEKYFKEIHFFNSKTEKTFFALCMKNESKGYEVRNPVFKGTVQKKDIIFIRGTTPKPPGIHVFEGPMDFVSVIAQRNGKPLEDDAIILTSLSLLGMGSAYIKSYGYEYCYTWMDNDQSGIEATKSWKTFCKNEEGLTHIPMNESYLPYKDINAHHTAKLEL